jgi:tRNA threonylcarbamoyladenosine biosynthesis protein TsaB
MKVLAVETSTVVGSVAVVDDKLGLLAGSRVNIKVGHAERLMPAVDWILKSSSILIEEIDGFAVSIGPGSFTGLRIGLSTVKGFCFATGKPLMAVPTLDAFAQSLPFCAYDVCPMFDARKKEVYTALYRWEGDELVKVINEMSVKPEIFLGRVGQDTVFMGDGASLYKDLIYEKIGHEIKVMFPPPSHMIPSASSVAEIGIDMMKKKQFADPITAVPLYIRKSEAEVRFGS